MIDKIILGGRIRQLRASKNISQGELGKVLKKSHAAISDIELGKTDLSVNDLSIISNYFGVSTSFLLEENHLSHLIQYRDKKNITPEQKKTADKILDEFIEQVKEWEKNKEV